MPLKKCPALDRFIVFLVHAHISIVHCVLYYHNCTIAVYFISWVSQRLWFKNRTNTMTFHRQSELDLDNAFDDCIRHVVSKIATHACKVHSGWRFWVYHNFNHQIRLANLPCFAHWLVLNWDMSVFFCCFCFNCV